MLVLVPDSAEYMSRNRPCFQNYHYQWIETNFDYTILKMKEQMSFIYKVKLITTSPASQRFHLHWTRVRQQNTPQLNITDSKINTFHKQCQNPMISLVFSATKVAKNTSLLYKVRINSTFLLLHVYGAEAKKVETNCYTESLRTISSQIHRRYFITSYRLFPFV